jgi:hypothetical protein
VSLWLQPGHAISVDTSSPILFAVLACGAGIFLRHNLFP